MDKKTAYIKRVKGNTFVGKSGSNFWLPMDSPKDMGGSEAGFSPKELLLLGLGGCTSIDVINILQKKRAGLTDYEVNITAELAEEIPRVYTKIHLEFIFYGSSLNEKDIDQAIQLSQSKYCSVTKMLEKAVDISYSYKIIEQ